ncbi:MAG: hypothetical protein EA357_03100 [Micavibrio sp.]|nr:MAG: hypothetical protein EA357_03100 [Micavibrio sp.]
MKLRLTDVNISPSEYEQRHVWSFTGTVKGAEVSFNFYDSGNNACYPAALGGFYYEGRIENAAMIEEAVSDWLFDNEDKIDRFKAGDVIRLDLKKTHAFQNSPRSLDDLDLLDRLRKTAKSCAEKRGDPEVFRKMNFYEEKEKELKILLREAEYRIAKHGLRRCFQLQNLAGLLKTLPQDKRHTRDILQKDALKNLAAVKPADRPAHLSRQDALRNFLRRRS